jgi:hypothetical protein
MTLKSTIKPKGEEYQEQPVVDIKQYWTVLEQTRQAFKDQGFDLGIYNEEVLGGKRQLDGNVGAEIFFLKWISVRIQ